MGVKAVGLTAHPRPEDLTVVHTAMCVRVQSTEYKGPFPALLIVL